MKKLFVLLVLLAGCEATFVPPESDEPKTRRVAITDHGDDWLSTTKAEPELPEKTYEVDDVPGPKWVVRQGGRSYDVVWSEPYQWRGQSLGSPAGCLMGNDKLYAEHYAKELNKRGLGEGWSDSSPKSEKVQEEIEGTRPESEPVARKTYENKEPPTQGWYWVRIWSECPGRFRSGDIEIVYVGLRGHDEQRYYDEGGHESMTWYEFREWHGGDECKFDFVPVAEDNPWYPSLNQSTMFTEHVDGTVHSGMTLGMWP